MTAAQATKPAATQQLTTQTQAPTTSPANNLPAPVQIAHQLEKMRGQLSVLLPKQMPVERFERVVMTAINLNPDLAGADRRSLFNACTKAAADGLMPDGREGALVIFKDNQNGGKKMVQWMPMTFGIIKKLRQSGEIASISARVVYENEIAQGKFKFVIDEGQERLIHEPILVGDRGAPALAYATARFKDGTVQNEPLTKADIEKAKAVSRSSGSASSPWNRWPDEMWRKTAIKRLSKYLPLSAEDRRIIEDDEPTEFETMKADAVAGAQSIGATAMLGLAASEPIEASQDSDADGDSGVEHDEDGVITESYRLVHGNDITDFTDPAEFLIDLSNALQAVTSRASLDAIEQANRETIARLDNSQKLDVAAAIDEAGKRIGLAAVGKKR